MKKKYLFFDIDGTLVAGGYSASYIPDSVHETIDKLKKAGHFMALATGRSYAMAIDFMKALGFENMVHDGGYGLTLNNELLGITPLDKDKVCALIDECKEKGFSWGISVNNDTVRFVPDESFMAKTHDTYMNTKIVEGLDPRNYEKIYKAFIACSSGEEERLDNLKQLPWCRFHEEYFFVEPADKAYGIKKVMDHFGAP
jgi:hypothetical protein